MDRKGLAHFFITSAIIYFLFLANTRLISAPAACPQCGNNWNIYKDGYVDIVAGKKSAGIELQSYRLATISCNFGSNCSIIMIAKFSFAFSWGQKLVPCAPVWVGRCNENCLALAPFRIKVLFIFIDFLLCGVLGHIPTCVYT
jgi:hypothetical protein